MEENKYHIENREGEGMVCEPAPAYRAVVVEPTCYHTSASYDEEVDYYDAMPLGRTLEDVREHCAHFEEERNDPSKWMTVEEFNHEIHQRHPWWE